MIVFVGTMLILRHPIAFDFYVFFIVPNMYAQRTAGTALTKLTMACRHAFRFSFSAIAQRATKTSTLSDVIHRHAPDIEKISWHNLPLSSKGAPYDLPINVSFVPIGDIGPFDHVVVTSEQNRRHRNAERFSRSDARTLKRRLSCPAVTDIRVLDGDREPAGLPLLHHPDATTVARFRFTVVANVAGNTKTRMHHCNVRCEKTDVCL